MIVAWETGEGCCVRVGNTLLYSITSALATVGELLECSLRECGCSCPSRVVVLLLCRSHCISQVLAEGYKRPPRDRVDEAQDVSLPSHRGILNI